MNDNPLPFRPVTPADQTAYDQCAAAVSLSPDEATLCNEIVMSCTDGWFATARLHEDTPSLIDIELSGVKGPTAAKVLAALKAAGLICQTRS